MKKLLLILSAVFVSVMAWAQNNSTAGLAYTLNPYAYDLSIKSWDLATRQLTVQFKLNAPPNLDDSGTNNTGPYNTGIADKEPNGIQIYAVDQSGNEYRIGGLGRDVIQKGINNGYFEYTMDLSAGTTVEFNGGTPKALPVDEPLTWKVRVKGRSNQHVDAYKVPRHVTARPTDFKRPRRVMGVGVGTNPLSPNFGRLFTSEADNGVSSNGISTFGWLYDALYDPDYKSSHVRMPAMLEYTPQLKFVGVHKKYIDDSDNNSHFELQMYSEPHRVKVSEDGRIFVSSYHQGAGAAVKEYLGNNTFRTVIKFNASINNDNQGSTEYPTNSKYNRRAVDFDVKGSGDDLNILVAWVKPKGSPATGNNKQWNTSIEIYEYKVGKEYDIDQTNGGTLVAQYIESNPSNHLCGYLFQSYYATGYCAQRALIGVGYGSGNNDIWLKVDPGVNFDTSLKQARIIYFNKAKGNTPQNVTELDINERYEVAAWDGMPAGEFYGGGSIIVKDNKLYTYAAMTATGTAGVLRVYTINSGTLTKDKDIALGESSPWANGFAIDYANNLYLVSEWIGNIKTISLPYSGVIETPAPANSTFSLADPVPNILATDLRYDIVRGKNQYEFSFNVNTKPEEAQIRFYESYEDMQKSLNVVNADDFNGTNNNKPVYVYNIPADKLIQGRIAVTLGAVGGQADANGVITNDRLPAGVLYWSVYVKTRKSCVFAPIYRQEGTTIDTGNKDNKGNPIYDYERRHIVVNNYPETDMFGALIVAHNPSVTDDATRANRGLHIYGFNPEGNSNDEQGNINNNTRYSKRAEYLNQNADGRLHYPRRLVVGHDGKVYVADAGTATASRTTQGGVIHEHGGVKLWDPTNPNKFALFSDNKIGTATGVALYEHADGWKLYANNTYDEFSSHGDAYTPEAQDNPASYGWNGFVGYVLDKYTSGHNGSWSSWGNNATEVALRRGDASGNFAFAAMDKGLWICQYREHTVDIKTSIQQPLADNFEAYILSFVPYGANVRTWRSSEGIGVKSYDSNGNPVWDSNRSPYSQYEDSPLQSTPGGGVAYKKINGKEYVYVVNHDGNIAVLEITGWTGTGVSSKPTIPLANIKILTTPEFTKGDRTVDKTSTKWHTAFITSMCFDYAGNLVTTTGKGYHDAHQDILVYTMPYDRVNAREIQAPNSCRMIPERIAQLDMTESNMDELIKEHITKHPQGCAIDLYRPLQGGMFNTICLPCTLDLRTLPESHPLYEAELKQYTGLNLNTVGGEKVLELVFTNVSDKVIIANEPYIIEPKDDYNSIIRFAGPLRLTNTTGEAVYHEENSKNYNITYQGIIPYQEITPVVRDGVSLTLMLVSDNRLAEMTTKGYMYGFRGYFQLNQPLPKGMQTRITTSKGTTTNTTIVVDGKKVNVEKFLQEGRVYIRMGDSLYTITGEKVE